MVVAVAILMAGFVPICLAESSAKLDKHARKIEKRLSRYRTGTLVQIDFRDNSEARGTLGEVSEASFQITNADSNKVQTFNFADVARVRKTKEYIGAGSEPEHHFRHWIPVVIVAAAVGGGVAAYEATR
jgi:hypothetical protein